MAVTDDQATRFNTQPRRPDDPSRTGFVIAATVSVILFIAVVVGAVVITHHGKATGGTTPRVTTPTAKGGTPTDTTPSAAVGGVGSSADIPAAQTNPPSLAGAYSTDPIAVMRTLSAYSDWLFAHPNPTLLANYMLPSSRNYAGIKAELTTLAANGWHARPSVSEIAWIKANGAFTPAAVLVDGRPGYVGTSVKVVIDDTPQSSDVLNSAGQVTASLHNIPEEMLVVALAQGSDGRFRISDIAAFNPPGGIAAFES